MHMPEPDQSVLARRGEIIQRLKTLAPAGPFGEHVIDDERSLRAYESDGLSAYRQLPMVVVLPETVEQISAILSYCNDEGIKVMARLYDPYGVINDGP